MPPTQISIVSDIVCPWCWVGKRNLEAAIKMTGRPASDFVISWLPYQLRPQTPQEGIEKPADTPGNPRVGSRLREAGLSVGIDFTGKTDRAPNTLKAHTLLKFALLEQSKTEPAGPHGIQNRLSEVLFQQYFTDGIFVGDDSALKAAASQVGLDAEAAMAFINNDENLQSVAKEVRENGALRSVNGVPTFFINGRPAFSGAQPPERFLSFLGQ